MFASKDVFLTPPSAGGYTIARSVRFRSSASAYLSRTPATASNRKTWTWSGWVKRGTLGSSFGFISSTAGTPISFGIGTISTADQGFISVSGVGNGYTTAVFHDPAAWYHVVIAFDTTQATAANRVKFYVNGTQYSLNSTLVSLNTDYEINNNSVQLIGTTGVTGGATYLDGYLTEINFIDGQALTPSSFGSNNAITGVWQPIKYTGTYGTNGFYLNFSDNSNNTAATIGKDYSGNGNNWTPNNISVTAGVTYDSMTDVPTLTSATVANYAVMNPLWQGRTNAPTNGNLDYPASSVGIGTMDVSLFSSYWEITSTGGTTTTSVYSTSAATTVGVTTGLTYGFRFNSSTGGLDYTTNGSSFTSLATGLTSGPYFVYVSTAASTTASFNGGQRPFSYTPPTGFVALNTYNLPASTIKNGAAYMAATTYTGNGSTQTVNNSAGFYPDFNWIKARNNTGSNVLVNSVVGGTKQLFSNLTNAEQTDTNVTNGISSSGIALGNNSSGTGSTNQNTYTYVLWQWLAGGGTSASNTNGSITSTVSANTTAGFSVVTYTGTGANATVGHGLGVAPKMMIVKARSVAGQDWLVYSSVLGATQYLILDLTNAAGTASTPWNNTAPTSSVFSVGTSAGSNTNGTTYVAYCWSEVAGYSKFGSYTGNGSADGAFVYLGFRPRFVLFKRTDTTSNWLIIDSVRGPNNSDQNRLFPNLSNAEDTSENFDLLSNGFKLRDAAGSMNVSGGTYIFAAFAENPFKNSLAR